MIDHPATTDADAAVTSRRGDRASCVSARTFKNAHGISKAREAAEREAKALENYHSPRWQEHPQQWIVSAPAAQQARGHACVALTTNVVFKFIDNEFLFRNYTLEQIANGDNADHFFVFEHG